MPSKIYVETSVISYLTSRPGRDVIVLAQQEISRQWWAERERHGQCFISDYVLLEIQRGDSLAAQNRRQFVQGLSVLSGDTKIEQLAQELLQHSALPPAAQLDALHIATATVYEMDYVLTWNCKHIANASKRHIIEKVCEDQGYRAPILTTPLELMEN
jgi:predicted nucleic acid-binding protein